jgi:hypothetical protein
MTETDLYTLHVSLHGWFDTGMTTYGIRLARYHYAPEAPVSKRLTTATELLDMRGELFLSDTAQKDLTRWTLKAIDHYATGMLLP